MSVEVILHPKQAAKRQLKEFLEQRGYVSCGHLWKWSRGSLHFHWFNSEDYLSFDGVEATIFRPKEDRHQLGPCRWALHTRTRLSGSPADKAFQTETIRQARALFGGNFYNDWAGRNRYTPARKEHRDPASRGLFLAYEGIRQQLSAVEISLPPEHEGLAKLHAAGYEALARLDPARILYNALVPFAVASLERFLSESFSILVKYDTGAQAYLTKQTRKVDFDDCIAVAKGTTTLEALVTSWYSFQNLASIQKAFSEWLGIDFRKVMRERSTTRAPVANLAGC